MIDQEFFNKFLDAIPEQTKRQVRISMNIASQINYLLKKKNISQRELASSLNKKESEISKWLSGNHNFTIKTLASIEEVLSEEIIMVPIHAKKETRYIPIGALPGAPRLKFKKMNIKTNFHFEPLKILE